MLVSTLFGSLIALLNAHSALAALYVNHPVKGTTCTAGQPCTVSWLDDGATPLLTAFGACTVGLYHGQQSLVQTIKPVDVDATHSLTFTPNAQAGPNSDAYYISFTSISGKNGSSPYQEFSSTFSLTGMSGSFDTPISSLTRTISVPSSVISPSSTPIDSTSTIGTVSIPTASASPSGPASALSSGTLAGSSSRMITSMTTAASPFSSSSETSTSVNASSTANTSSATSSKRTLHCLASMVTSFLVGYILLI